MLSLRGRSRLVPFVPEHFAWDLPPYILIEFIEEDRGAMLSNIWHEKRFEKAFRTNLFRDASCIMLSLAKVPLPQIGSFTLDTAGSLSLSNRPLTPQLQNMENGGIPPRMMRSDIYTSIEGYALDLIAYQENQLRWQPNAVNDEEDCRAQMATQTGLRAILPHFVTRAKRNGPFFLFHNDMHQSNIFVDETGRITSLIDLEWACTLPLDMFHTPYWLTDRKLDELDREDTMKEYDTTQQEFLDAFEENEQALQGTQHLLSADQERGFLFTDILRHNWKTGRHFYFGALQSRAVGYNVFFQSIRPLFPGTPSTQDQFEQVAAPFWAPDADEVTKAKLEDLEKYNQDLSEMFKASA